MSDLIDKRDERTRKRKQVKRKMDSVIGLSFHDKDKQVMSVSANLKKLSDSKARLIDEGYIDNGFVIKKGTLEKYLNGKNQYVRGWEFDGEEWVQTEVLNLTPDFEGTVNLGHMDFSVMPFILGSWTKDDLTLVDTENDRQALDVQLHLDEESMFIKELKRQKHDIGISAEFWVHQNMEDTGALTELLGYYMPVFDEIFIFAYGLVGECGNVNSSGLELKTKEAEMPEDIKNTEELELEVSAQTEEPETLESETEIPPTEETVAASEEAEPEVIETEELVSEEAEVEEAEGAEPEDDEDESEEADPIEEVIEPLRQQIETLTNQVKELTEANIALKKTNRKLSNKLQSERNKLDSFKENVKGLAVELLPNEQKEKPEEKIVTNSAYYNGDGIGEL